jgi:hypothetical protein
MTRNKAFIGLVSKIWDWKQKGKRQKHSPFEGAKGVLRKREKSKLFVACTQISTQNIWKFGFLFLSLPRTLEP